jgi:mannose-1-phosphate guanylyltransferase
MEKSKNVAVIPARFDWNDLGSWDALESVLDACKDNTVAQASDCYFENAKGNISESIHCTLIGTSKDIFILIIKRFKFKKSLKI